MSGRVPVCRQADLQPGDREVVAVDGAAVLVVNVDGEYFAVENTCKHQYGNLSKGELLYRLDAEYVSPGERIQEGFSDDPVIACPEHGWEYDLASGAHCGDSDVCLRTFDTVVEDGQIYVEA